MGLGVDGRELPQLHMYKRTQDVTASCQLNQESWCQLSLVVNAMFLMVRLNCLSSCCCDSLPIICTQMLWDGGLWSPSLSTLVSAPMADGTLSHIHCFQELLLIVVAVVVWCHSWQGSYILPLTTGSQTAPSLIFSSQPHCS